MTEYSPAKTGEYPRIFPNFQNCARCETDLKDNKDNSPHLGREYARLFVLGHYLILVAHSFPGASLSENCSLLGRDNVRGQIFEHIFAPNGDYCLFIPCSTKIASVRVTFWACVFYCSASFIYFGGVFNKKIIPLALVGYEMIIANSTLRASLAIYHLITNARSWNNC